MGAAPTIVRGRQCVFLLTEFIPSALFLQRCRRLDSSGTWQLGPLSAAINASFIWHQCKFLLTQRAPLAPVLQCCRHLEWSGKGQLQPLPATIYQLADLK